MQRKEQHGTVRQPQRQTHNGIKHIEQQRKTQNAIEHYSKTHKTENTIEQQRQYRN